MAKKKPHNPFLLGGYYGRAYFCDREKELALMLDNFENGRNTVLYAWRRLGKTVLVQHFMAELEASKKAETLYVDLLATRDTDEALRQLTIAIYAKYGKTKGGISSTFLKLLGSVGLDMSFDPNTGLPSFSLGLRQGIKPQTSLTAIGEFLSERSTNVLIALDEFQQVANYPDENGEAVFRNWMQTFPGLRFIFSGSHRGMMTSMFAEKKRPFYRSAQLMPLDPIDPDEYTAFITKHFKNSNKQISKDSIKSLYEWSRGQTYCIQLICNKLYGKYDDVEKVHISEVCDEILGQESPVFAQYTNLLTQTQWKVLRAVARDEPAENPLSKNFLTRHQLGAASSVSTALNMLMKNEILIKEENAYLVQDVLLARWLQSLDRVG
jgi:AAA+ ATPase superfamily predicted ATPase